MSKVPSILRDNRGAFSWFALIGFSILAAGLVWGVVEEIHLLSSR